MLPSYFTLNPVSMSQRAGLRLFQGSKFARANFSKPIGRRYQTADATAAPSQSTFARLWNSPVGVKTVHFWYVELSLHFRHCDC